MNSIDFVYLVWYTCIYWDYYLVSTHLSLLSGYTLILQPHSNQTQLLATLKYFTQILHVSLTLLPAYETTNHSLLLSFNIRHSLRFIWVVFAELDFFSIQIYFHIWTLHTSNCKCLHWPNLGLHDKRDHCIFLHLPQYLSVHSRN